MELHQLVAHLSELPVWAVLACVTTLGVLALYWVVCEE